jgi:hypothetical protein
MKNIRLSERVKGEIIPFFECENCKRRLEEGELIALLGKTPPAGLSMPLGRADTILKKTGKIYCERCFRNLPWCLEKN